ncbi:MAG: hypothetical protein WA210_21725 [Burkholderiaceae bacterium]
MLHIPSAGPPLKNLIALHPEFTALRRNLRVQPELDGFDRSDEGRRHAAEPGPRT